MKKLLTIMTIAVVSLIGITSVNAATVNYNFKQYRVQFYNLGTGVSNWTSYVNFDTSTPISNGYGVSGIAVKFGSTSKFNAGQSYRVVIDTAWQPIAALNNTGKNVDHTNCLGTLTTSNWDANASRIQSCEYVGFTLVPNSTRIRYMYDITPSTTVEGLQFNIYFSGTEETTYINVKTTSYITTGEDITGAIEEQTTIITNVIEDSIDDLMNATHEYETEDITGEVEDEHEKQQDILDSLDDSYIESGTWEAVGDILTENRGEWLMQKISFTAQMHQKIFTMIITVLSLGIIKMVLGR